MVTAERIREDIGLALDEGRGLLNRQTYTGKRQGDDLVVRYRDFDTIEIAQHRIPRHRKLGRIASKPFLSQIIDREGSGKAFWLPEPFVPERLGESNGVRPIVVTRSFSEADAVLALFNIEPTPFLRRFPMLLEVCTQPPTAELLLEADQLLQANGIDNMRARQQQAHSPEPLGLERTAPFQI